MATKARSKLIETMIRAPFLGITGGARGGANYIDDQYPHEITNNFPQRWQNGGLGSTVEALRVDADSSIRIGGEAINPMRATRTFVLSTNGSLSTQAFWIADREYLLFGATEIHKTAGTIAGCTLTLTHETGTTAPGSGSALMTSTFALDGTANTLQTATINGDPGLAPGVLRIAQGDRVSAVFAGTLTTLAGVEVTLALSPGAKGTQAIYAMKANGDLVDQTFFIANSPMIVTAAYCIFSTKSSVASDAVQITKDTSTNAPGAGTDLLTNNTNAGFDLTATANTLQTGTLTATAASLRLAAGDRLSVDFAGTLTALAGVLICVTLTPVYGYKEVTFTLSKNANLTTQNFFTADRSYEVIEISEIHSVLGTNGGAVDVNVTIDSGTTAPGAGTVLTTDNTNAGFDLKATINTVQWGTMTVRRSRIMLAGDRLSVLFAGTLTAVAGVTITCTLIPK